jgi:hypothetical protein
VEAPPEGAIGLFCKGFGVPEGLAWGLYSVVWPGMAVGTAASTRSVTLSVDGKDVRLVGVDWVGVAGIGAFPVDV